MSERFGRRGFLVRLAAAAGASPAALAVLAGRPAAAGDATDLAVLYAAIQLENQAIDLYGRGLEAGFFAGPAARKAADFRGDHIGHRDTQIEIARERGGALPRVETPYPDTPGDDPVAWQREALAMEEVAIDAYSRVLRRIGNADQRLASAYILVDEVRHETAWRADLGLRIYQG